MRLNKNIKIITNYFLGPLLFIWLSFSIYRQVQQQSHLQAYWHRILQSFQSAKVIYLATVVLLMTVNWGLEALKWKLAVAAVHYLKFRQAFTAILSGVSFSVTTPNRVGEYLGRMMYLPEGKRLKVVSATLVGSLSQILITLFFGGIGLLVLKSPLIETGLLTAIWYRFALVAIWGSTLILTGFYFALPFLENWGLRVLKRSPYLYLIEAMQHFRGQLLSTLLGISGARYLVFMIQYLLLFRLFDVEVPAGVLFFVMSLVFLALAIVPSIALVEVGIRGEVSLQLVGLFTANSLGILLTSVSVWLINLVIPALMGSLLILKIKVFSQEDNTG